MRTCALLLLLCAPLLLAPGPSLLGGPPPPDRPDPRDTPGPGPERPDDPGRDPIGVGTPELRDLVRDPERGAPPTSGAPALAYLSPPCLRPGARVTLHGYNLGAGTDALVFVHDPQDAGDDFALEVTGWGTTQIVARVPAYAELAPGARYQVGIASGSGPGSNSLDATSCALDLAAPHEPGTLLVLADTLEDARGIAGRGEALGFERARETELPALGLGLVALRAESGADLEEAAQRLATEGVTLDLNHDYALQADPAAARVYAPELVGIAAGDPRCGEGLRLGVVDTAVDRSHPSLDGRRLETRRVLAAGAAAAPHHGTGVAALLIGDPEGGVAGLLPASELLVAEAFEQVDGRARTRAETLLRALDWLVGEEVAVINLSLGGPRNRALGAGIERAVARGVVLVAAAGNGGPAAAPTWPGAHPDVVAVTAVDAGLRVWDGASRGSYVDFAAPGVDVWTAAPGGGGTYASGTSYATPFVAAALGLARRGDGEAEPRALRDGLAEGSRDLGRPGRDPVFGHGLVQIPSGQAGCASRSASSDPTTSP